MTEGPVQQIVRAIYGIPPRENTVRFSFWIYIPEKERHVEEIKNKKD